ncbi:MAG: outer membrane beta-barrel protein [Candidatus Margulisbacteria bacterium]|nr:outer membrane beta-barrel protein [Candidatus Margulisiibacteriota bacterium]
MKKTIVCLLLLAVSLTALPVWAIEGTTTIKTADLFSLANRKTYRLGIRGSLLTPTKDVLVSKDSSFDLGLEFDAKLNENLDTGPRFGYSSFKNNQGAAVNATYSILRFGYGARIYLASWGETTSTHGLVNAYLNAEANYYTANKGDAVVATSPSTYAGLGGQVGAGAEFALGPNTSVFADFNILKTSVKDSGGTELPLDGYTLQAGTRLAFF